MFSPTFRRVSARPIIARSIRLLSTLKSNHHIYIHPSSTSPNSHILSLLSTSPSSPTLAIGTTTKIPPTPDSLTENPSFLKLLNAVLQEHAASDPGLQSQAAAFASTSGSALGSGGMFFPQQQQHRRAGGGGGSQGDGAGGASGQGGAGGGGKGGWVHLSDSRAPPDYGRIAWPEDIFGSLEVDGSGQFVEGKDGRRGNWQESGTYRVVTREGILGLSDYLIGKVVERLRELERKATD